MTVTPMRHYSRNDVSREIVDYCRGRWVALEGDKGGRRVFIRYLRGSGEPLKIVDEAGFRDVLYRYREIGIRSVYGSVNIYRELHSREGVRDPDDIIYSSPVWDVDGSFEYVDKVLEVAKEILDLLYKFGIDKSIYLIWSGRGVHIHIHERAFSRDILRRYNPLDISFATVEYIIMEVYPRIRNMLIEYSGGIGL